MTYRRRNSRRTALDYRDRKDHLIDAQLVAIHRQIASKLQTQRELLERAESVLAARANSGRLSKGNYLAWTGLLDMLKTAQDVHAILLEDSVEMRKLRRVSPLSTLLTEQEREQALAHGAAGQSRLDDLY